MLLCCLAIVCITTSNIMKTKEENVEDKIIDDYNQPPSSPPLLPPLLPPSPTTSVNTDKKQPHVVINTL